MCSPPHPLSRLALPLLFALCAIVCPRLSAQEQESGVLTRILNPDRTLKYSDSDRKFDSAASVGTKSATVRAYPFTHAAGVAGDGAYPTKAFASGKDGAYKTGLFATKGAKEGTNTYAQQGKTYAVKAMPVQTDRAAGKSFDTRAYVPGDKPFLIRGKRQDTIDEMQSSKNMTVEQVRELLNKNQ